MRVGPCCFLLQSYYVEEGARNFVLHLRVSDVRAQWANIEMLELAARYGVKTRAPQREAWGLAAGLCDPSGVLWRIAQPG